MNDPVNAHDSPIVDDLDVEAAMQDLGMSEAQLDAALALLEAEPAPGLLELWHPEEGFEERVTRRARQRLRDRQALAAFTDLFGLGWHTASAVLDDEEDRDDRR